MIIDVPTLNRSWICLIASIVLLLMSCSTDAQHTEYGIASYYHDSLEGNLTASGEVFSQDKFTAAHKTLPLGTWVLIKDMEGQEVVVRINDRLPANSSRMIDLTTAAARELKMIEEGLKRVSLNKVSKSEAWVWYFQNGLFW